MQTNTPLISPSRIQNVPSALPQLNLLCRHHFFDLYYACKFSLDGQHQVRDSRWRSIQVRALFRSVEVEITFETATKRQKKRPDVRSDWRQQFFGHSNGPRGHGRQGHSLFALFCCFKGGRCNESRRQFFLHSGGLFLNLLASTSLS